MSKQGKRSSAKLVAWAVALCMILGVLSPTLMYAQVSVGTDIEGHWAEAQIERWIERGIVKGYEDGTFKPENPIKRCEFAALMNRTFGFVEKAEVDFSDIEGTEWFVEDIAKAVAAGYMKGDAEGTFRPEDPIARQEAALVLARIYELEDQGKKHLFKDLDEIASWSFWAVMAVADAGLMEGYPDGTFGPKNPIKRSETVTVLDRLVAEVFAKKGVYGKEDSTTTISGNVHVLADGVEIQNTKITGDLLIAQSVGYGTVILENVTVDGNVKVQGGGKDSIILRNSKIGSLEVAKKDVRIAITGSTKIAQVYVKAPSTIAQEEVEGEGIVVLIIEELIGEGVVTLSGNFEEVRITGEDANVDVVDGQVENLYIEAPGAVVELGSDATITNLVVNEPAEVTGTGSIINATINASGTVIEPEPENVTIPEGVTVVIAGEESVGGGEPPSEPVAPPVGPVFVPISAISVDDVPVVGMTIKAKDLKPSGANVDYQWQRAVVGEDDEYGDFADIDGATDATYTLKKDSENDDVGALIRLKVTGKGSYRGTKYSDPVGPVVDGVEATFTKTDNIGIAPETAGDAAGKIFAEYELKAKNNGDGDRISLKEGEIGYIKVQVGDNNWETLKPNTDETLWFNVENATGERTFVVKVTKEKAATYYTATLNWEQEINEATWVATGKQGIRPETEDTYVEYKLVNSESQIPLEIGEVKLIASKDAEGKWVALEPNTDATLWFNKAKETGNYEFFVVTKDGAMYKATLDWRGGNVYDALKTVNDYLTEETYMYGEAPGKLESHLTTLGINVGDESDYAKLDKTAAGGKNRKTAVFYDLNSNKPDGGYDLATLTTYFNDMVATRLVTEESMDLVNNAENIEDLNGISFVTMLLERFRQVSYQTHSDIPVAEKITTLQGLVDRYEALGEAGQKAVLDKIIKKRPEGGYARSQATTDALDAALTEIEEEINARLEITSVSIADNTAYASTAAGEGNTVRVLGYGVCINLCANDSGKKVIDTSSIVIELYKGETLLGQQTFKGFEKHKDASSISGTIDAGGQYVATSWDNSWSEGVGIDQIPDKAVATVQYSDGTATAEMELNFTEEKTKIFYAAEAVYALFVDPLADVESLALKEGVTQENINTAQTLVEAVSGSSSHKTLFTDMITKANSLLHPDQGSEDNGETGETGNGQ